MTDCPLTEEEWKNAEMEKKCESGVYHCLRTQGGENFTLEVCAPRKTMIEGGGCPYWNDFGDVDRVDCSMYPECPDKPILSNKVFKYPFCYEPWRELRTKMVNLNDLKNERDVTEMTWLSVLFYFLSCAVLVALIFFMARYYSRERRGQKQKDYKDPEQQPVNDKDNAEPTEEPMSATPFLPEPYLEEDIGETVEVNEETGLIRSEAYKEGLEAVNKDHLVLIIGSHGSGKTATGNEILSTYRKRNWKCTLLDGLHKADSNELHLNFNIKQVIFVDNCFGYWTSDLPETRLLQIRDKLKFLFTNGFKRPGDIKLILSIGKVAYSKHKRYLKSVPGLLKSRTIDLDSDGSFSSAQKEYMINNLLANLESVRDDMNNEKLKETLSDSSSNDGIGFPLKVQLLLQLSNLPVQDFLQNAPGCLRKHFEEMQNSESESGKLDYAALVYVMLKRRFSDKCRLDKWCTERLYGSYGEQNLKRQLQSLDGKYLKRDHENFYVFAHGILYIAVFHAFYHDDPECLLEHCNTDAILELVRSGTQGSINDPFVVNLKMADFPVLVERIANMHLEQYFADHQLQDTKSFQEMLDMQLQLSKMENMRTDKTKNELRQIEEDIKHNVQKMEEEEKKEKKKDAKKEIEKAKKKIQELEKKKREKEGTEFCNLRDRYTGLTSLCSKTGSQK